MAKFQNIKSGETVVKPNKQDALTHFKEKDESVTRFHIKSVVVIKDEKIMQNSSELPYTNKMNEDGKAKQDKTES